jgi:peptide/nickel transport system permease protein
MLVYIIKRFLAAILTVFVVSIVVFTMLHLLPGDPIDAIISQSGAQLTAAQIQEIRSNMGLDKPLPIQYINYIKKALHGDLGRSFWSNRPVFQEIIDQIPFTLELAVASLLIATVCGLTTGIIAALNHNRFLDNAAMFLAIMGVSMPNFWLGLILILVFCLNLGWFPIAQSVGLPALVLPAFSLGIRTASIISRMTRSGLLEVFGADYIRTARAKGVRTFGLVVKHALRNAFIPIITMLGLQFGELLAGSVVTETVFARRGMGQLVVSSIKDRDFPLAQGVILVVAIMYIGVNLIVDIFYSCIDPRIRYD